MYRRRAGPQRGLAAAERCRKCRRPRSVGFAAGAGVSGVKEAQVELFRQAVAELDDRIQQLITHSMTS